jgi:hypothetical protein
MRSIKTTVTAAAEEQNLTDLMNTAKTAGGES